MAMLYCFGCRQHSGVDLSQWQGACPRCSGDFVELLPEGNADNEGSAPRTGRSQAFAFRSGLTTQPSVIPLHMFNIGNMGDGFSSSEELEGHWMDVLLTRIMEDHQPRSQPTKAGLRNSLPLFVVRAADAEGEPAADEAFAKAAEPCAVCHDQFLEGTRVAELPCSHCFHAECLIPWLESHNTCPICRIELPLEPE